MVNVILRKEQFALLVACLPVFATFAGSARSPVNELKVDFPADAGVVNVRAEPYSDIFMEDTTASPHGGFLIEGKLRLWARQFNVENFVNERIPATLDNRGGQVWILGIKTEQGNRLVTTRNSGKTEILGGLVYTVTSHEGRPAFIVENADFALSVLERCFMGKPMNPVVRETLGENTKSLGPNSVIGLYVSGEK